MVELFAIIVRWLAGICSMGEWLIDVFPHPVPARVSFHTLTLRSGCRGVLFAHGIGWKTMRLNPVPFACKHESSFIPYSERDPTVCPLRPATKFNDVVFQAFSKNGLPDAATDAGAFTLGS